MFHRFTPLFFDSARSDVSCPAQSAVRREWGSFLFFVEMAPAHAAQCAATSTTTRGSVVRVRARAGARAGGVRRLHQNKKENGHSSRWGASKGRRVLPAGVSTHGGGGGRRRARCAVMVFARADDEVSEKGAVGGKKTRKLKIFSVNDGEQHQTVSKNVHSLAHSPLERWKRGECGIFAVSSMVFEKKKNGIWDEEGRG